ncbi:RNA polymerase factor sigma-32 [Gammaproteobacteria bacterium]|nr:RNA polymerase factor sigma-32 [Gammaproteobacteria bacterium]
MNDQKQQLVPKNESRSLVAAGTNFVSYTDSLAAYLQQISQIPLLSPEEEYAYAKCFKETGDVDAAQYLVMSNLRFVVYIAKGFQGYGLPLADMIQQGNLGLMKAVQKFDPDQKVRFISYAVYWIRCDINEYIIKNMRMVKSVTSKDKRKLMFNLGKHLHEKQGNFSMSDRESLAKLYGVKISDIEAVEMALSSPDMSLDAKNHQGVSLLESLPESQKTTEERVQTQVVDQDRKTAIYQVLFQLDPRQREIIESRWLSDKKASLDHLAERFGISMQRVSQIEKQALAKFKALLSDQVEMLLPEEA